MIVLTLPLPLCAERYWRVFVSKGSRRGRISVTREGHMYRELVRKAARQAGVHAPLSGGVVMSYVLYPKRPDDWRERFRQDPAGWDDAISPVSLDGVQRVLVDALRGVVFESDGRIRRIEADRGMPDEHARVEVRLDVASGEPEESREEAEMETHEASHGMAHLYPAGTIVVTPSGRQAVVLRYLQGTGKADMFERAICRYLDSTSDRECVTLQPRFLRRIE